ncbi:MAG: ribonuclease III [Elusimicrobia bacterium]|nr:ribonuclease III [Elusimicrobiota bacterium]MBD3412107.1 ribonuclease III [Elusimicrobiota bacterium]
MFPIHPASTVFPQLFQTPLVSAVIMLLLHSDAMSNHEAVIHGTEEALNIHFINKQLLLHALVHKSYAIEHKLPFFNERLEFLGDSILSAVVAEYLYTKYPHDDEGKLSRIKSQLVSKTSLVSWSTALRLNRFVLLSQGEESSGGRKRESISANVLEAFIGALYLDQGYEITHRFIIQYLSKMKRFIDTDYKSRLQEIVQQNSKSTPVYRMLQETGPDHNKRFKIAVHVNGKKMGSGTGRSKKEAEQIAARAALKKVHSKH